MSLIKGSTKLIKWHQQHIVSTQVGIPKKVLLNLNPQREKNNIQAKNKKKLNNLNNNLCEVSPNSDRSFNFFRNKTFERDKTLGDYEDWEIQQNLFNHLN